MRGYLKTLNWVFKLQPKRTTIGTHKDSDLCLQVLLNFIYFPDVSKCQFTELLIQHLIMYLGEMLI